VQIRDGPAAVTGDEHRMEATGSLRVGKARLVGRTGSQKTCLKEVESLSSWLMDGNWKIRGYYRESPDQFLLTGDFFIFRLPGPLCDRSWKCTEV